MYKGAVTASSVQCKVQGFTGQVILLEVEHCNQQPELRQPRDHLHPLLLGGQSQVPIISLYRYCFICKRSSVARNSVNNGVSRRGCGCSVEIMICDVVMWKAQCPRMAPGHPVGVSSCSWSSRRTALLAARWWWCPALPCPSHSHLSGPSASFHRSFFSPEVLLGVTGKVLMKLVVAPTQVFGGSSCDVSNCYSISFGKMTDTFFWKWVINLGAFLLLEAREAFCGCYLLPDEKKQLKKHCPVDTVVLAIVSKEAQNPFVTLKFSSPCVYDGHIGQAVPFCWTLRGAGWNARLCKTEDSATARSGFGLCTWCWTLFWGRVFPKSATHTHGIMLLRISLCVHCSQKEYT